LFCEKKSEPKRTNGFHEREPMVFMKGTSGLFMQLFRNCDYIPFGGRVGGVLFLITVQEWYFLLV
jgi:hypothetical protein